MRFLGGGIGHSYMRELKGEFPGFLPGVDFNTGEFNLDIPDDQPDVATTGPLVFPTDTSADMAENTEDTGSGDRNKDVDEDDDTEDNKSEGDECDESEDSGNDEGDESGSDDGDDEDDVKGDGDGDEQFGTLEGELGFDAL